MKKIIFTLFAACFATAMFATDVNYTVDNTTIFPNPERGFLIQLTRSAYEKNAVKGKNSEMNTHANTDKGSLVLTLYYLDEFIAKPVLPDSILDAFDEDMEILRGRGMKAIVRIAYAEERNGEDCPDAPLSIIKQHLDQFKSHWAANADVIYCFQAGFVGQYGEWYYTNNFTHHVSKINELERELLDTALKAVPQNRCLLLRRPMFKLQYIDSVPLNSSTAYKGTNRARLGHYNDAFLYDYDNMGTYRDTALEKPYLEQETFYVPLGGETDIDKDSLAYKWASHDSTVAEMSRLHWSFIKSGYSHYVTDKWRANGTFDELNRNMGYRFQLVSAMLPEAANAGENVNIALNIKNVGYAPLYNERHAYIVLKNAAGSYSIRLNTDPRTWLPNGVITAINEQITIPNDVPDGTYNLYIHMPDAYESLAEDSRYSIRFANEDVWKRATGMNSLKATITIGSGGSEGPDPEIVNFTDSLNKANVNDYSDNMLWYQKDYFDFATGGKNTDAWAEWRVNITTPGKYVVTEVGYYTNGHNYSLQLFDGNTLKSEYTTAETWSSGYKKITQTTKWDLCDIPAGTYTLRVKNAMENGAPKLKTLKIDLFGAVSSDTVNLNGTFNQANVANYSNNMKWYNTEYFDFNTGGLNTDGWAEWRVNLTDPGKYTITEVGYYPDGHKYQLQLLNGNTVESEYTTAKTYSTGDLTITQETKWDLEGVSAGIYKLRVNNALDYGKPKLKSLTLEYEGVPSGMEEAAEIETGGQMYDILGRPVDESYRGVIIMRGKKILR